MIMRHDHDEVEGGRFEGDEIRPIEKGDDARDVQQATSKVDRQTHQPRGRVGVAEKLGDASDADANGGNDRSRSLMLRQCRHGDRDVDEDFGDARVRFIKARLLAA